MQKFHETLKALRKSYKWSQSDLAERIGVVQSVVAHYENGSKMPSTDRLYKIASVFDVSLTYLLGETTEKGQYESTVDEDKIDIWKIRNAIKTKKLIYKGEELSDFEEEFIRRIILAAIDLEGMKEK